MHSIDITRNLFQPKKHYSAVLHHQGAVALESDQNEGQLIQKGELAGLLTDIICAAGSPDDGFKIGPLGGAVGYDFSIEEGVFYLGGMRLVVDRSESFRAQTEFLQLGDGGLTLDNAWLESDLSTLPDAVPGTARTDLVWIEAHEQAVSGAEDGEIIDQALAIEVSSRVRPIRQVHLAVNNPHDECHDAFDTLVANLEADGKLTFDPDSAALESNRRMLVDFVADEVSDDPCQPPTRRGYLGAENDTIQVRIISEARFAWSTGNAAPLYRVKRTAGSDQIVFENMPRDAYLRPLLGDMIELIRPTALLPNGELIGEQHGIFYKVASAFDPSSGVVGLTDGPDTTPFHNDTAHAAEAAAALGIDAPEDHLYARVWRGETINVGDPGNAINETLGWTKLGNTGLRVHFTGDGPVGDFWIFSVRPNTPDIIVPWGLRNESKPTGPLRHIAPLGLIHWSDDGSGVMEPDFHDCRHRFRKLCEASGCCEITVGDGHESRGDVNSIEDAISLLPSSGGKICLLRGRHKGTFTLEGRTNVTLSGCGELTRVYPDPDNPTNAVVSVIDSTSISISGFLIEAHTQVGINIVDSGEAGNAFGSATHDVAVSEMAIETRNEPAIVCNGAADVSLRDSRAELQRFGDISDEEKIATGNASAFAIFGHGILVERCRVQGAPLDGDEDPSPKDYPAGGIQIYGGSEEIEIRRNTITDGRGIGIKIGSVSMRADPSAPPELRLDPEYGYVPQGHWTIDANGCIKWHPSPTPEVDPETGVELIPDADPLVNGLLIQDNDIRAHGESGIGAAAFFDLTGQASEANQICGARDLIIRENRIEGCVCNDAPELQGGEFVDSARGGVALGYAENLQMTDNRILENGVNHTGPICGIFVQTLSGGSFTNNEVRENGQRVLINDASRPLGRCGGLIIRYAQPGLNAVFQTGADALLVQGNRISAPEGRALQVQGVGAMSINDNQLVSRGANMASFIFFEMFMKGGDPGSQASPGVRAMAENNLLEAIFVNPVVSVTNLGWKLEEDLFDVGIGPVLDTGEDGDTQGGFGIVSGNVMFSGNQTRFDALAPALTIALALVGLISLDDVHMNDNQCDADLFLDGTYVHGLAIAISVRMANNRFSEPTRKVGEGDSNLLSGFCAGRSVLMHHNFGAHCFMAQAIANFSILVPNRSWVSNDRCRAAQQKYYAQMIKDIREGAKGVESAQTGSVTAGTEHHRGHEWMVMPEYDRGGSDDA